MAKKPKDTREIALTVWPARHGAEYFDRHWTNSLLGLDDCLSCWLQLRLHDAADKYAYMSDEAGAIRDIGVYVWVSRDGTVSLDLRLHDIHSLDLREAERRLKTLKAMHAKAARGGYAMGSWTFVKTRDVHGELMKLFQVLKIVHAVELRPHPAEDVLIPVAQALRKIADEIDAQVRRMGGWKEQPQQLETAEA